MRQFVIANNFEYFPSDNVKEFDSSLFKIGENKLIANLIKGPYKQYPIRIFNYNYTVENIQNRQEFAYMFCELEFDAFVPSILLINRNHNFVEFLDYKNEGEYL